MFTIRSIWKTEMTHQKEEARSVPCVKNKCPCENPCNRMLENLLKYEELKEAVSRIVVDGG